VRHWACPSFEFNTLTFGSPRHLRMPDMCPLVVPLQPCVVGFHEAALACRVLCCRCRRRYSSVVFCLPLFAMPVSNSLHHCVLSYTGAASSSCHVVHTSKWAMAWSWWWQHGWWVLCGGLNVISVHQGGMDGRKRKRTTTFIVVRCGDALDMPPTLWVPPRVYPSPIPPSNEN